MLAVREEATAAFVRKDWATLASLVRAFEEPSARMATAWCHLEQGDIAAGVAEIQQLFRTVAGPLQLDTSVLWNLWALRKRFGPTALIQWGLHEELIAQSWLGLRDLPVNWSVQFTADWVEPALFGFMVELPAQARAPLPWQLGGAGAILEETGWREVFEWLRARGRLLELPDAALAEVDTSLLAPTGRELRAQAFRLFARQARLQVSEKRLRELALALDAKLMLLDVQARVPPAAKNRVKRVLFRATPKRVVDAVVVALVEAGQFGALVRHVVPDASSKQPGKTTTAFSWVEGMRDDVVAVIPAPLFEAAVKATG